MTDASTTSAAPPQRVASMLTQGAALGWAATPIVIVVFAPLYRVLSEAVVIFAIGWGIAAWTWTIRRRVSPWGAAGLLAGAIGALVWVRALAISYDWGALAAAFMALVIAVSTAPPLVAETFPAPLWLRAPAALFPVAAALYGIGWMISIKTTVLQILGLPE